MNDNREFDLLADLAKLLSKYGPETFETLAKSLSAPDTMQSLVKALRDTAIFGQQARLSRRAPNSDKHAGSVHDELVALERFDPQKHELLTKLYQGLQDKSVLPTFRDLKDFAAGQGLPPIKGGTRQKAIGPFIRSMIALPISELSQKLQALKSYSRSDRGLEGWSKIILDRDWSLKPNAPSE